MNGLVPFFFASAAVHLGLFLVYGSLMVSSPQVAGLEDGDENRIFVTVVSQEEVTAQEETPASRDSSPAESADQSVPDKDDQAENPEKEASAQAPDEGDDTNAAILTSYRPEARSEPVRTDEDSVSQPKETGDSESKEKNPQEDEPEEQGEKEKDKNDKPSLKAGRPTTASAVSRFWIARGKALADYNAKVQAAIREATIFPKKAARRRLSGSTTVRFTLTRDGSIVGLRIVQQSGEALLDEAAVKIVQKASKKFPAIPPGIVRNELSYVVPIVFKRRTSGKK